MLGPTMKKNITDESAAIAAVVDRFPKWARERLRDSMLRAAAMYLTCVPEGQLALPLETERIVSRHENVLVVDFPDGRQRDRKVRKRSQLTT